MRTLGVRQGPHGGNGDAMPGIVIGVALIQGRLEGIKQAQVDGLRGLAEGRAQVINRMRVGVVDRKINTLVEQVAGAETLPIFISCAPALIDEPE